MPDERWQVEIYTASNQKEPHTFSAHTKEELQEKVYAWLLTSRPQYIQSGTKVCKKEGWGNWRPYAIEDDKQAYRAFCTTSLAISLDGAQHIEDEVRDELWSVEIYTASDQVKPRIFSHSSQRKLRDEVYSWLRTTHPLYVRSGTKTLDRGRNVWKASSFEEDEQAYRDFCDTRLDMHMDPAKLAKQKARDALSNTTEMRLAAAFFQLPLIHTIIWGSIIFQLLNFIHNEIIFLLDWVMAPVLIIAIVAYIVLMITIWMIDRTIKPRFHHWFKTYGVEAVATIIARETTRDADGDPSYFLICEWQHPKVKKCYTRKIQTSGKYYIACSVDSTHPVLLDPDNSANYEIYLHTISVRDAMAGQI